MRPPIELWQIAADLEPLAGGNRSTVVRTRGLTQNLVFKSTHRTAEQLHWLLEVHDIARSCGFVVPELIAPVSGALVHNGWTCERLIEGRAFRADEMSELTPLIACFQDATAAVPQRPGFLSSCELLEQTSGGDVDLAAMPSDLVALCRAAWSAVADRRQAVVHGDLNPTNMIRCLDGRIALLDWDESRRDLVLFDQCQSSEDNDVVVRARLAWEVACCWQMEPDYARHIARRLRTATL